MTTVRALEPCAYSGKILNSSISSNSSGISDKPERDRRGSLCPVFNDQRAMEMVAKAALAKK